MNFPDGLWCLEFSVDEKREWGVAVLKRQTEGLDRWPSSSFMGGDSLFCWVGRCEIPESTNKIRVKLHAETHSGGPCTYILGRDVPLYDFVLFGDVPVGLTIQSFAVSDQVAGHDISIKFTKRDTEDAMVRAALAL